MSLIRQIKDLRQEFASIHSHVLRRVIEVHGCIPLALDPKRPLRRTLLPGFLVIGGLPSPPPYDATSAGSVQATDMPEPHMPEPEAGIQADCRSSIYQT